MKYKRPRWQISGKRNKIILNFVRLLFIHFYIMKIETETALKFSTRVEMIYVPASGDKTTVSV